MSDDPLLMAVDHVALAQALAAGQAPHGPAGLRDLELAAACLAGSEVVVLCRAAGGGDEPLLLKSRGRMLGAAFTAVEAAPALEEWARASAGALDPADLLYRPVSARALVLSQWRLGRDGVAFNTGVRRADRTLTLLFGSLPEGMVERFWTAQNAGFILPEEFLGLLAAESDPGQCQQLAREFLLSPSAPLASARLFLRSEGHGREVVRRMYTTNAAAALWSAREGAPAVAAESVGLMDSLASLAAAGRDALGILIDEKLWVDADFAGEILRSHVEGGSK